MSNEPAPLSVPLPTVSHMLNMLINRIRSAARRVHYPRMVPTSAQGEQAALVALLRERPNGLNWRQLTELILQNGSADETRKHLIDDVLFPAEDWSDRLRIAADDVAAWERQGLEILAITDERYPARVRDIQEAPPLLFARGLRVENDVAVSVVGSRKASPRGLQMSKAIAEALVSMEVTVVAGLAAGIDTAAHRTALTGGGRTVAVIGTGINQSYPATNRALQERIAGEGLVLSQFWPDSPPQRHNFPMRNAVMSGYGIATVVVEAGEHSGARSQARMAVHHGRPVILTDLVVARTEWARQLQSAPDVYVAASVDDVRVIVSELLKRPAAVSEALSQIAV